MRTVRGAQAVTKGVWDAHHGRWVDVVLTPHSAANPPQQGPVRNSALSAHGSQQQQQQQQSTVCGAVMQARTRFLGAGRSVGVMGTGLQGHWRHHTSITPAQLRQDYRPGWGLRVVRGGSWGGARSVCPTHIPL